MTQWTPEAIQKLAESLSINEFGRPFLHRAYVNPRLRTTGGRYLLSSHNIEVNATYLEVYGEEELIGILKHELCHYHLHLQGKGYKHGDADFKELLKKTGAPRFCRPLPVHPKKGSMHLYVCSSCRTIFRRRRKVNVSKYVCGKCRGILVEQTKKES